MCRALVLSPRLAIASGGGPIQVRPASITACAKSAFSERNPYPGCTASAPDWAAIASTLAMSQIRLAGGVAAQRIRLVGGAHVRGVAVGVGVDGDTGEAGVVTGTGDADCDLAAVGDKDLAHLEHSERLRRTAVSLCAVSLSAAPQTPFRCAGPAAWETAARRNVRRCVG